MNEIDHVKHETVEAIDKNMKHVNEEISNLVISKNEKSNPIFRKMNLK